MEGSVVPRRQLALRSYLLLLIAGSMLPFLIVSGVLLLRVLRDNREGNERTLLESAEQQAAALDAELDATVRTLQALAASPSLTNEGLAGFAPELQNVVTTQPGWLSVRLLDLAGGVVFDTARPHGPGDGTAVDPASVDATVSSGAPVVATLRRGPNGRLAFGVRVPVRIAGALRYVLTAVVTPETVGRVVARLTPGQHEWTRVIVDSNGTVVARTRSPERFVGEPATPSFMARTSAGGAGVYRDTSLEGVDVYVAFAHSPLSGWVSSVVVPVAVMDGPLRQSMTTLVLVGLIVMVASIGGANWLAGRISSEIGSAAHAAEALSRGQPVPASTSIVTDVTRLRQALEQSSTLLIERGEERDRHLAQAEAARADAENANLGKDQFLAMLGHELRNPLAPIVTALGLLKARGTTWTKEHAVIERQVAHMSRLVDDLLDVSRITRGALEIRRDLVQVDDVITRATEMAAPLFERHRHKLTVEVPAGLQVRGDSVRLAQVFCNLLTNAAEYTPNGGAVSVTARRVGGDVVVDVTDNGRGISPELAPRIFDLFVQGPRTIDRGEGGLGLGLAIASSLTSLHGGRIVAHSEGEGRGCTFTVRLPAQDAEKAVAAGATVSPVVPGPSLRVLVVDDNSDATEMLSGLLTTSGHTVATAADGQAALDLLETFDADVALLDIGLPVMDGLELARRIRARMGADAPLLVAVTGYGQAEDVARSRAAGFAHHLVKPVDPGILLPLLVAPR
jgi:signal transduction histidine kinase/CheY-like chemotaxis protein